MRFVPQAALMPGMVLGKDIISSNSSQMLKRGVILTEDYIDYICQNGYMGAYINDVTSAEVEYSEGIDDKLFRQGVSAVSDENVGLIVNVAAGIVADISSRKDISMDLFDLRSFDDYTYHHSVNVAVYAVAVGRKMGLKDKELSDLSMAAICHDLGKSKIPEDVLNKPGRLTDAEFKLMQQHPRYSFDILNNNREISAVIKQAVLFHHENQNGSGYPFGKTGKEMSVICRIIHAVDVYDALTSKRPYKDPFAPADAYKYLNDGRDILFDSEVISAMTQVIPAYPPGIEVKLSSGESALVLAHTADAFRPKVKILDTGKIINMYEDEEYEDIIITESSIMPSDYVSDIEGLNEDRSAVRKVTKDTVMIVDDTKLSLIHTKAALDDKYNVLTFANPLDAINYFKENKAPDLVIMDIEMPFINGIDAVKHIRKLGGQKTPVIFFTGTRDAGTVLKCREVGAIDYIVKPSTAIYIQQRVAEALGESLD